MKKLNLETIINASRETVWDAITNKDKFRQWTSAFQEGSYYEGGWNKGDKIHFLIINKEGQKEGMASEIAESKRPGYLSIRHIGYVNNGIADTSSEEIRKWAPAYENYTLEKLGKDKTKFVLDMDIIDDYYEMFLDLWPKAMKRLREISEAHNN